MQDAPQAQMKMWLQASQHRPGFPLNAQRQQPEGGALCRSLGLGSMAMRYTASPTLCESSAFL